MGNEKTGRLQRILRAAFVLPAPAVVLCAVLMAWVFLLGNEGTWQAYAAYVVSAWALAAICASIVSALMNFKIEEAVPSESLAARLIFDRVFRSFAGTHLGLAVDVLWGGAYFALGVVKLSLWTLTLGVYYICLAVMRSCLVWHIHRRIQDASRLRELGICRTCGALLMASALPVMGIVMLNQHGEGSFYHHKYVTIGMAAYAFASLTTATLNFRRYHDGHDALMLANTSVRLAQAAVSMLTLSILMTNVFGSSRAGNLYMRATTAGLGFVVTVAVFVTGLCLLHRAGRMRAAEALASDVHEQEGTKLIG